MSQPAPSAAAAASQPQQHPASDALDHLQAMLNLILLQTGRYLSDPSARKSPQTQLTMKSIIPTALNRFHVCLDELEDQLLMAQAVLRRDLAVLQADRIKREQAEEAQRKQAEAECATANHQPPAKASTDPKEPDDVPMEDAAPTIDVPTGEHSGDGGEDSPEKPASAGQDTEQGQNHAPASSDTTAANADKEPEADSAAIPANLDDFDAMFADLPSATNNDAEDSLFNLNEHAAPSSNFLEGLEDFARSGENPPPASHAPGASTTDFSTFDFHLPADHAVPPTASETETSKPTGQGDAQAPRRPGQDVGGPPPPQQQQEEHALDDLDHFNTEDYRIDWDDSAGGGGGGGAGGGGGGGPGGTGGGYNANSHEHTQFDDAIWGLNN